MKGRTYAKHLLTHVGVIAAGLGVAALAGVPFATALPFAMIGSCTRSRAGVDARRPLLAAVGSGGSLRCDFSAAEGDSPVDVTLLFFDGCPNWRLVDERLTRLADELGFTFDRLKVDTAEDAERLSFRGSPTVLVDGRDPFARGDEPVGLSCRVFETPDGFAGTPTDEQLRDALAR